MTIKANYTLLILSTVIGLALGAGGGYYFSNSSLQPIIDELETQTLSINGEIEAVQSEIQSLENEIINVEEDIGQQTNEVEDLEAELTSISQDKEEIETQAQELSNTRSNLEELVTPRSGHYKFSLYGLSFDYPKDMELELVNAVGEAAESSWGTAIATRNGEHDVGVTWISMPYTNDILDIYWNSTIPLFEEVYDAEVLEINMTTISGYPAKVLKLTETIDGDFQWSKLAAFYCHSDNKLYVVQYNDQFDSELTGCNDFFNSIHVEGS